MFANFPPSNSMPRDTHFCCKSVNTSAMLNSLRYQIKLRFIFETCMIMHQSNPLSDKNIFYMTDIAPYVLCPDTLMVHGKIHI
jgi:hypothetical protein